MAPTDDTGRAAAPLQLPNPFTPMAFLPPDLAFQTTILTNVFVASLGVIIWDVLHNLYGDYLLLTKYRISIPVIAYFISRVVSLVHVLAATIFSTTRIENCVLFEKVIDWIYPVAVSSTSLLFFFRVRAVFADNKKVIGFFAFMWLAVVAGCLTTTQGITGSNIGITNYCTTVKMEDYVEAGAIIPLINDTLIFLAITWRLMGIAAVDNVHSFKTGFRILAFGDYMPSFSRAVKQDGQLYYLTVVTTSLMSVIIFYIKSVPMVYRTMFPIPNLVLMNIMACRVYRNTKFGIFREATTQILGDFGQEGTLSAASNNLPIPLAGLREAWKLESLKFKSCDMNSQGIEDSIPIEQNRDANSKYA